MFAVHSAAAAPPKVGDDVVARWSDGLVYTAVVKEISPPGGAQLPIQLFGTDNRLSDSDARAQWWDLPAEQKEQYKARAGGINREQERHQLRFCSTPLPSNPP